MRYVPLFGCLAHNKEQHLVQKRNKNSPSGAEAGWIMCDVFTISEQRSLLVVIIVFDAGGAVI